LFAEHQFDGVLHLAAESHVIVPLLILYLCEKNYGTMNLLMPRKRLERELRRNVFITSVQMRFMVALGAEGLFTETTAYDPNSPYSIKASSDLCESLRRNYGLPYVLTNCSNNYGPFHFPEVKFVH
jgi:dTDP-glucose 4,6-dehydratase